MSTSDADRLQIMIRHSRFREWLNKNGKEPLVCTSTGTPKYYWIKAGITNQPKAWIWENEIDGNIWDKLEGILFCSTELYKAYHTLHRAFMAVEEALDKLGLLE